LHSLRAGFTIDFTDSNRIWLVRGKRRLALAKRDLTFVPIMMECFDVYFKSIVPVQVNGREELDFSQPAFHTYQRSGMGFFFPPSPKKIRFSRTPTGTRQNQATLFGIRGPTLARPPVFWRPW